MTRLQASMKESSMRRQSIALSRVAYKVGSFFKGCSFCGQTEEVETKSGGMVLRFLTGYNVFRAYDPPWSHFTWWCYDCGAKDLECWSPDQLGTVEAELGKPPVRGSREGMAAHKYALRKELMKLNPRAAVPRVSPRASEIARLEREVEELMAMLKGGKR